MKRNILIILCAFFTLAASCSKKDDMLTPVKKPVSVILDADLGGSNDDLFAMQLLYRYADQGRCKILGIVIDRMGDTNAAFADLMNNYYGYSSLPVALERQGAKNPDVYINYCPLLNYLNTDSSYMFPCTLARHDDLPDGFELYRKILAHADDHSVVIVATGFLTSLSRLLTSAPDRYSTLTGLELVRRKVKTLYFMGTKFAPDNESNVRTGYNIYHDLPAAEKVFRLWPGEVDIILSPSEVGNRVVYDSALVVSDLSRYDIHPIRQTYLDVRITSDCMWDAILSIAAVEGDGLFSLSYRGNVTVDVEKMTVDFHRNPSGNCRYQHPGDSVWNRHILDIIRASN